MKTRKVTNVVMKGILKTALAVGAVGMVVVAPNTLQAIDKILKVVDEHEKRSKRFREHVKNSGYFSITSDGTDQFVIRLSEKGKRAAKDVLFEEYIIPINKEWDRYWYLLMFDVAEKYKAHRDILAQKVKELGMQPIQDSVYVYPYDVSDFAKQLREHYPYFAKFIISARVESIDGEDQLRKRFQKII